jgi:hypothetical protein
MCEDGGICSRGTDRGVCLLTSKLVESDKDESSIAPVFHFLAAVAVTKLVRRAQRPLVHLRGSTT